jgi:adenylosuccinate synthase
MKSFLVGMKISLNVRTFEELPNNAQHYVERIAQLAGVEIATFSVGPERDKTAFMKPIWQ